MPQFSEEARGAANAFRRGFCGARGLLGVPPMRFLMLAGVALAVACGSVSSSQDGGGGAGGSSGGRGGTAGTNGGAGTTGAAGTAGTGGVACVVGGVSHPGGTTFPSADGCNSCTCTLDGQIACTERACPPDGGIDPASCAFDATYTFGNTGGLAISEDDVTLSPPASYVHTRHPLATTPPDVSCAPALPPCNSSDLIDVADVMRDIADPDVQSILSKGAKPGPVLGYDSRPVDGQVFQFVRSDGVGLFVGSPCTSGAIQCTPIPAGVSKLVADLRALDTQQLKDASCAALR